MPNRSRRHVGTSGCIASIGRGAVTGVARRHGDILCPKGAAPLLRGRDRSTEHDSGVGGHASDDVGGGLDRCSWCDGPVTPLAAPTVGGLLTVPAFAVVVHGRGLWISIDDEIQRVGFRVTRVVEAPDPAQAALRALAVVSDDPRSRSQAGHPQPTLLVEELLLAPGMPERQPGFAFYSDPEETA